MAASLAHNSNTPRILDLSHKLIECQTCFRTFHTQAQFGQHSRICKGGRSATRKFIDIGCQPYKYCFLEKQNKDKLEIKSRFIIKILNLSIGWKDIAKNNGLHDSTIAQLLKSKQLDNVHVAIRHRKESGIVIANFVIRAVDQTADCIHAAKLRIEEAVDEVKNQLPPLVRMEMHLCTISNCKELVIRDTEGYCSRHRAQKYHKKNIQKKRTAKSMDIQPTPSPSQPPPQKRMKLCHFKQPNNVNAQPVFNYNQFQYHQFNQRQYNQMQQIQQMQRQHQMQQMQQIEMQIQLQRQQQQRRQSQFQSQIETQRRKMNAFSSQPQPQPYAEPPAGPQNQISFSPVLLKKVREFFHSNSYILQTPASLYGVSINESALRSNGMNIISVDYATSVPNPKQVLQKNGQLVVFASKGDTQKYLGNISTAQDSIRLPLFCQELTQNYIACVPTPECLVGSTLAQTPQLAESGINAIAVNLEIQHPATMSNTPLKANDMLLCCFNRADDKYQQFLNALRQIKQKKK